MKKSNKKQQGGTVAESKPAQVVGLDLGDRYSRYCLLSSTGEMMEEGRMQTTAAAIEKHFGSEPRMRIALEAGTHSPWVSRLLKGYGHQVIVANPRKIPTEFCTVPPAGGPASNRLTLPPQPVASGKQNKFCCTRIHLEFG